MKKRLAIFLLLWLLAPASAIPAQPPDSVFVEELTWVEVRDAIKAGKTTIIFPTGGTEQNGPHMVLGKHNFIVKHSAEQIARRLGNALVAPVLAYVPEGNLNPPTGHMLFPGSITLPEEYFMKVTEYAARSFRVNGFKDIVLIGDSGPNQKGLRAVAALLNKEWSGSGVHVHYIPDYYFGQGFAAWLKGQGETPENIGTHAGIEDTSELMAIDPNFIRKDKLAPGGNFRVTGVTGNPARASVAYGKQGLEMKIAAAVAQIQKLIAARRK
jgi:creatinine amidohydrolase/Fe(II)-dependent formamide hydrolase-like protein